MISVTQSNLPIQSWADHLLLSRYNLNTVQLLLRWSCQEVRSGRMLCFHNVGLILVISHTFLLDVSWYNACCKTHCSPDKRFSEHYRYTSCYVDRYVWKGNSKYKSWGKFELTTLSTTTRRSSYQPRAMAIFWKGTPQIAPLEVANNDRLI